MKWALVGENLPGPRLVTLYQVLSLKCRFSCTRSEVDG